MRGPRSHDRETDTQSRGRSAPRARVPHIPSRLLDRNLLAPRGAYPAVCLLVRISVAIALMMVPNSTPKSAVALAFAVAVIGTFTYKYYTSPNTWKNYLRVVMFYALVAINHIFILATHGGADRELFFDYSGALVAVDALVGYQSYYATMMRSG